MSKLISPAYAAENRALHEKPGYGSSGHLWLGHIVELVDIVNARSLIDYGAGKATLARYLKPYELTYTPYDPATFPALPKTSADIVVALDVLEHIEPEALPAVLEHMHSLTDKVMFCNVSTRPSSKALSDGRNAHLITRDWYGWKADLTRHFKVVRLRQHPESFEFVGIPLTKTYLTEAERNRIKGVVA